MAGTGFAWGDWYAFVAVDDVEVGERSLHLNSLSAPQESAPTPYVDQVLRVNTHPNGTMVVGLRLGDVAPFRSAVRVAYAAPLGSLSKSAPESTLLFEVDGVITALHISPSGEVLYFQVSGSWYAAPINGGTPVHLLDDPYTGRNGDVSVAFQGAGLVYACESTIDGSAVAGIVDPESAAVTDILEDDPPGVLPLAPFLDGGLALWHELNLEDSHRYDVTLLSGETSVIETDELSFSHLSLSPDQRWVTTLGGSSEPPLEVHSLESQSVVAEFPELDPSTLWHPTQPVLFARKKAPFGPGITRLSIRGDEVVELDTIPAGLPPDAQEVTNFELVPGSEFAMATVVTSRGRIWGRIDLTEANPAFTPLHDDSFEAGGRRASSSDGLSAIGAGPDSESGQETLYLVQLNSEPRLLLETNAVIGSSLVGP